MTVLGKAGETSRHFIRRNLFKILSLIVTFVLAIILGYGLLHTSNINELNTIRSDFSHIMPILTVLRICVFVIIILSWKQIASILSKRYKWDENRRMSFIAIRWRLAIWLVLLELIIVQGIFSEVFA